MSIFRHTATINKFTSAQTSSGAYNPTYAERIASVKCLIQGKRLTTTDDLGRATIRNIFRLYCDNNATTLTIDEADRVVWGTRTFEILGINDGGGQAHHLEIDMDEIK